MGRQGERVGEEISNSEAAAHARHEEEYHNPTRPRRESEEIIIRRIDRDCVPEKKMEQITN